MMPGLKKAVHEYHTDICSKPDQEGHYQAQGIIADLEQVKRNDRVQCSRFDQREEQQKDGGHRRSSDPRHSRHSSAQLLGEAGGIFGQCSG